MTTTAPARRRRPPRPMCPVTKTDFAVNLRTGRRECWGAISADQVWHFVREDDTRTDWLLYHWPSVQDRSYELPVELAGTLGALRECVERGWAIKALARLKAMAAGWEWTGVAWRHFTGAIAPGGWNEPPAPGAPS